mmetsp:Transcript_27115/g.56944  ORF Transcript_27115/g.56944 Transcript_27115/m.56944 type:complete len:505 (+) Transcript_27115:479-1993(+)
MKHLHALIDFSGTDSFRGHDGDAGLIEICQRERGFPRGGEGGVFGEDRDVMSAVRGIRIRFDEVSLSKRRSIFVFGVLPIAIAIAIATITNGRMDHPNADRMRQRIQHHGIPQFPQGHRSRKPRRPNGQSLRHGRFGRDGRAQVRRDGRGEFPTEHASEGGDAGRSAHQDHFVDGRASGSVRFVGGRRRQGREGVVDDPFGSIDERSYRRVEFVAGDWNFAAVDCDCRGSLSDAASIGLSVVFFVVGSVPAQFLLDATAFSNQFSMMGCLPLVVVVVVVVIVESCASKVSFPNVPRQAFVDVVSAETRISGGGRDSKPNAVVVVVGARTVQNGDGDVRGPSSHVEHQHPLFVRRVFLARRVRRRRRRREQSVRHGRRGRFGHDADVAFEAGAAGRQAEGASLGLGVVRRDSDDGVSYSYSYSRRGSGGGGGRRGGAGDANAVSAHAGGGEEVVVGGDAEGAEQDGGGLQGGDQDGVVVVVVFGMTLTCDSRRGRRFVGRCERVV